MNCVTESCCTRIKASSGKLTSPDRRVVQSDAMSICGTQLFWFRVLKDIFGISRVGVGGCYETASVWFTRCGAKMTWDLTQETTIIANKLNSGIHPAFGPTRVQAKFRTKSKLTEKQIQPFFGGVCYHPNQWWLVWQGWSNRARPSVPFDWIYPKIGWITLHQFTVGPKLRAKPHFLMSLLLIRPTPVGGCSVLTTVSKHLLISTVVSLLVPPMGAPCSI